jgi:hypothetical protein
MISALSMPCRVNRRDSQVGVPELALDDDQRHTLAGHLDGVRLAQLVGAKRRRTPAWNSGSVAGERRRPAASSSSSDMTPPRGVE